MCVSRVALLIFGWYTTNTLSTFYTKSAFVVAKSAGETSFSSLAYLSFLVSFTQLAGSGLVGYCYYLALGATGQNPWTYYKNVRTDHVIIVTF